jgi:hypothetical protein
MRLLIPAILLFTICSCKNVAENKESTYQNEIKKTFKEFNLARIEKNGKKIYDLSDKQSHAYYDSILNWSLNAPKDKLEKIGLVDHVNVLTSRIVFGDSLKTMTSKNLMIMTFNKSSMDKAQENATRNVKLGPLLKINESEVSSTIDGVLPTKFIKENEVWKYNYTSYIKFANSQMKNQGISNEEYIGLILTSPELLKYSENGYFLYPKIYTPIKELK